MTSMTNEEIYRETGMWPDQGEMVFHMPYLEDTASRCSVIIELGCGHGNGSTRAFERGLKRTAHPRGARLFVSVDENPDKPDVHPSIPCWRKVTGDSRELTTAEAIEPFPAIDLIYIDTEHTYEQLAAELVLWERASDPGTMWLFHDIFMSGSYNPMTDAILDFCQTHPEWEYVEITRESHGMGMMRWKEQK